MPCWSDLHPDLRYQGLTRTTGSLFPDNQEPVPENHGPVPDNGQKGLEPGHQENVIEWSTVVLNASGPPRGFVVPVVHLVHTDPL